MSDKTWSGARFAHGSDLYCGIEGCSHGEPTTGMHKTGAPIPPPLPNPTGGDTWYHGTSDEFRDSENDEDDPDHPDYISGGRVEAPDRYASEYGENAGHHWNTDLGAHFTSVHHTAEAFATHDGGYSRNPYPLSRILHAGLHMGNPKAFANEREMGKAAIEHAHSKGMHFLPHPDYHGHEVSEAAHMSFMDSEYEDIHHPDGPKYHHLDYHEPLDVTKRAIASISHGGVRGHHELKYIDYYLALHPQREEITEGFRKHLQKQGHDGITYSNQYEAPSGHTCAITFPDTVIHHKKWQWLHPTRHHLNDNGAHGGQEQTVHPNQMRLHFDDRLGTTYSAMDATSWFRQSMTQTPPEGMTFEHHAGEDEEDGFDRRDADYGHGGREELHTLTATHPDHGQMGTLKYWSPRFEGDYISVHMLKVPKEHQRRGVASALMDEMQSRHPGTSIMHGYRTPQGRSWWGGYTDGKTPSWGRTQAALVSINGQQYSPHEYVKAHPFLPTHKIFGEAKTTFDPRLFLGDTMKPEVRDWVMARIGKIWYIEYHGWQRWARIYLAGSEATYWWGNNDLDILIGIEHDRFREDNHEFRKMADEDIDHMLTQEFREHYNDEDAHVPFDPKDELWHLTAYVNPGSWDIRDIKPYGAYEILSGQWYVRPPDVPQDWNAKYWDESTWDHFEMMLGLINSVRRLHEPDRTRQGAMLYEALHADRSRAFSANGYGWTDPGNVVWKALDLEPSHPLDFLIQSAHNLPEINKTALNEPDVRKPLPIDGKTLYRMHYLPRKWDTGGGASSAPVTFRHNTDPESQMQFETDWIDDERVKGYSSMHNPHDLHNYLDEMGWYPPKRLEHKFRIVQFTGEQADEGYDSEPTTMPGPRRDRIEHTMDQWHQRLSNTPDHGPERHWSEGLDKEALPPEMLHPESRHQPKTSSLDEGEPLHLRQRPQFVEGQDIHEHLVEHKAWHKAVRKALAMGHISPEQAKANNYSGGGAEEKYNSHDLNWQPLPHTLYHVTSDADSVKAHGIKSREELSQHNGKGLGGGESDTISFTTDEHLAHEIHHSLHEYHDVLNGRKSVPDMLQEAREGTGANRPFLKDLVSYHGIHDWKDGDDLPRGMQNLVDGKKEYSSILGHTQARMDEKKGPGWQPHPESHQWETGKGETMHTLWHRPYTPEEKQDQESDFYKRFSGHREGAGGRSDPMFFCNDNKGFAAMDPKGFAVLKFHPRPGAHGYPMGGMKEWRTTTGDAVILAGEHRRPDQHTAMGANGPDYEGLTFEHSGDDWVSSSSHDRSRAGENSREISALHPEHGEVGTLTYTPYGHDDYPAEGDEDWASVGVDMLHVHYCHRRRGVANALMNELHRVAPSIPIDHGARSTDGRGWAKGYFGEHGEDIGGRRHNAAKADDEQHSLYRGLTIGMMHQSVYHPHQGVCPACGESHGVIDGNGIGHHENIPLDPNNDQHILDKLTRAGDFYAHRFCFDPGHPSYDRKPMYGKHWTADEDLARQFALDPRHGQERVPRMPGYHLWGAVMEAHSKVAPEHDSLASQYGETEVKWPGRNQITGVTIHLHHYDPEDPKGRRQDTHFRSFEAPEQHWKTAAKIAAQAPQRFFHGTGTNFNPGDVIRPGSEVGRKNHPMSEPGKVYLHPDPGCARIWAEEFHGPDGRVYEVRPHQQPVPDMDHDQWGSQHTTTAATVVRHITDDEIDQLTNQIGEQGHIAAKAESVSVAGIAIKAEDTGRVLLLQRSMEDEKDPARGDWEFPGGHLEDGEDPYTGGKREWCEETGAAFPDGHVAGNWLSGGIYQGFVVVVPTEDSVGINADHEDRHVLNPDDPDGDGIEVVAWWEIEDLPKNPAVRKEVKDGTDWKMLEDATTSTDDPEDHKADQKVALVQKFAGESPAGRVGRGTTWRAYHDPTGSVKNIKTATDWHQFDTNHGYRQGHVQGAQGDFEEHDRIAATMECGRPLDDWDLDFMVGHSAGQERARDLAADTHRMKQVWDEHGEDYGNATDKTSMKRQEGLLP